MNADCDTTIYIEKMVVNINIGHSTQGDKSHVIGNIRVNMS